MIVRGEERLGARVGVNVFDRRPGDRQPVIGRGAAADLVEQDQRARRRRVEDGRRLRHLDHESRAAARQVVGGADAGEDAVHQPEPRRTCGTKRSHLRHQHDQRGLPQIGRLAAHVRPGDQQDGMRRAVQIKIVGHEAVGDAR